MGRVACFDEEISAWGICRNFFPCFNVALPYEKQRVRNESYLFFQFGSQCRRPFFQFSEQMVSFEFQLTGCRGKWGDEDDRCADP